MRSLLGSEPDRLPGEGEFAVAEIIPAGEFSQGPEFPKGKGARRNASVPLPRTAHTGVLHEDVIRGQLKAYSDFSSMRRNFAPRMEWISQIVAKMYSVNCRYSDCQFSITSAQNKEEVT